MSLCRWGAEDFLDGFKIAHAVNGVRFQIAALSPFVPRIDGNDAGAGRALERDLFRTLQSIAKPLRCVVNDDRPEGVAALGVHPICI